MNSFSKHPGGRFDMNNPTRDAIGAEILSFGIELDALTDFIQSVVRPDFLRFGSTDRTEKAFPAALVEWLDLKMPGFESILQDEAQAAASMESAPSDARLFGLEITRKAQDSVLCFLYEQLTNGLAGVHAIVTTPNGYAAQSVATVVAMEFNGQGYFVREGAESWVFEWVRWNLRRGWRGFQEGEAKRVKPPVKPTTGGSAGPELRPAP